MTSTSKRPAWKARADLRTALGKLQAEDLNAALKSLSWARSAIRYDSRLSVLDGLSEHISAARGAIFDTQKGRGSWVVKAKQEVSLALAIVEAEVENQRTNRVILGNTEYQVVIISRDPESGTLNCDLHPIGVVSDGPEAQPAAS